MNSGIYKITNLNNGKFYIGSAVRINRRWNVHRSQLRSGKHHSIALQRAWNKYGEDAFEFSVVEYVDREHLLTVEQEYIDKLNPCDSIVGYNVSKMASAVCLKGADNPNYGKPMSAAQKEKIRQALIRHKVSDATRRAISESCKRVCAGYKHPMHGLPVSQERRDAQSEKMKGRFSGEKNPFYGKTHNQETISKMAAAKLGKTGAQCPNSKTIKKISTDGCVVQVYVSATEAARDIGGDITNISACCRGKLKTAYGYIWRYADQSPSISKEVLF